MFRNRNGYWMSPKFFAMYSPDDGGAGGAGDNAPGGTNDAGNGDAADETDGMDSANQEKPGSDVPDAKDAEIARLKAEMAKQKAAMDKAASEASAAKKALKAKMTQEEIDAANKQEADEKAAKELDELRREVAKGKTVKSVMGKLGLDEDTAGTLADALYGAADIENVLLSIQKAWQAKETLIRKEYGKVTGPGAGVDSNSPEMQAIARAAKFGKDRNAQNEQAQKALQAYIR